MAKPSYTIKYLGISLISTGLVNGNMGVLSKRAEILQYNPLYNTVQRPMPTYYCKIVHTIISQNDCKTEELLVVQWIPHQKTVPQIITKIETPVKKSKCVRRKAKTKEKKTPKIVFQDKSARHFKNNDVTIDAKSPTLLNLLTNPIVKVDDNSMNKRSLSSKKYKKEISNNINSKSYKGKVKHVKAITCFQVTPKNSDASKLIDICPDVSEYMIHTYCLPNALPIAHIEKKEEESKQKKSIFEIKNSNPRVGFSGNKISSLNQKFSRKLKDKEAKVNLSKAQHINKLSVTTYVSQYKEGLLEKYKGPKDVQCANATVLPFVRSSLYTMGEPISKVKKPIGLKIPAELSQELELCNQTH